MKEWKEKRKSYRYKFSGNQEGKFRLIKKEGEVKVSLEICSNCLELYNTEYISNKSKANFKVKEDYLEKSKNNPFKDMYIDLDICTIPSDYSKQWGKISKQMKEMHNWTCEKCREHFPEGRKRKFLHTHHKDGNKRNNSRLNLEVLCIECHSEEHNHGHVKKHPDYKEYMKLKKGED